MSDFIDALSVQIEEATKQKRALRIIGGGSKDFYGGPLAGDLIEMSAWSGITAYEPTELVMSARAGTPLKEIEQRLAENNQMLAFEPPRLAESSTIGGVVAAGLSGPRRGTHGSVKDYLLGATLLNGHGQVLHFGGTVMKNVAGYDVSKLLAGSLGCLGIILDVSIKVLPKPVAESSLCFEMDQTRALHWMNECLGKPLPISATCWYEGKVYVRLSGANAAIQDANTILGGTALEACEADQFWNALRDQQHHFFDSNSQNIWRLAVQPSSPPLAIAGETLIEWAGGQRWLKPEPSISATAIRAIALLAKGHATLYSTHKAEQRAYAFHDIPPALRLIQQRLKHEFDPASIFNLGRMSPIF
jgi:glycolate oxidase FAD binding subunit